MATPPNRRSRTAVELVCALLISTGLMPKAIAHELASDRLTVVMREPSHLSLVFLIDQVALLRRLVAPDATAVEFVISMAAMSDTTFDKVVDRGRSQFESDLVILDQNGSKLALHNWRWSSKEELRGSIRSLAMAAVVGGDPHTHDFVNEITAEAVSSSPISRISLRLPKQAAKTRVGAYRPKQSYVYPSGGVSLAIEF